MRRRLVVAIGLLVAGCGDSGSPPTSASTEAAERQYGRLLKVPEAMIGRWKYVGQVCEADSEESPSVEKRNVTISFGSDFRYEMDVEGWRFVGNFRVDRFLNSPDRIQLDETLYAFQLSHGRLENWSEGEAVYPCGNIFQLG